MSARTIPPSPARQTGRTAGVSRNGARPLPKVAIIRIDQREYYDQISCGGAIVRALREHGINPNPGLLYRGVSSDRKGLFLKKGTDHPSGKTVLATPYLYEGPEETDNALFYAFQHFGKPMIAVYEMLRLDRSHPSSDVYKLDGRHPSKSLLALVLL